MERDMNVDQAQASKGIKKKASTEAMAPKQGATSHRGTLEMVSLPGPPLYRTRPSEDYGSTEARPLTPAGPSEPSRRGPPEVKTPLPEPPSPRSKPLEDHRPAEQRPLMPAGPSEPSRRGPPEVKSPVPGPTLPRSKPLEDHGPAEQRPLTPAGPSEPARASVNRGPAAVRPLLDQGPIQSSRVSESSPVKRGDVPHGRLRPPGPQRSSPESSINWCCSTVGLLSVCTILLAMVVTMNGQVSNLMERTEEHKAVVKLHIIILTDILMALQIGKVYSCSICRLPWVQRGDSCYLFRHREMAWHQSMSFCRSESSSLPVANTTEELIFLRLESKKHFDLHHIDKYHRFWIGLKYDIKVNEWRWTDGSPFDSKKYTGLDQKGCAYLQNGHLASQQCTELAYVICEAKTLFD